MSTTAIFTAPIVLWDLYVEYLWRYEPGSWVDRTASTFRVLAFLVVMPFVILTMLDVASYVIARTLGVIETTKASTGGVAQPPSPSSVSSADTADAADAPLPVPAIHIDGSSLPMPSDASGAAATPFFPGTDASTDSELEGNLALAGVDAFSPAPSQPPSPTLSRKDLTLHAGHQMGAGLRPLTAMDADGEEKSADGYESGDSTGGVQVRRRVRPLSAQEDT